MIHDLSKDLREFVALLVEGNVEFLVVGAYALAFHGHPRYTKDIDFFVRPPDENVTKLELLIRDFGFASFELKKDDFYSENVVIQLGCEPNRIDLITSIDGTPFEEAWEARDSGDFGGCRCVVLESPAPYREQAGIWEAPRPRGRRDF